MRGRLLGLLVAALALGGAGNPAAAETIGTETMAGEGARAPGDTRALLADGERWWAQSPDPENPVACATCHDDPAATRGWAASFPKFKPLPPPHGRVMTLLQANAEAVARHYRMVDPLPAATAITAYLAWHGRAMPLTPGVSRGQPVFSARMEALAGSVARGSQVYARRCSQCHEADAVASSVPAFPRVAAGGPESLERFLERHAPGEPMAWDGQPMADVIAYLTARLAARPASDPDASRPSSLIPQASGLSVGGLSCARPVGPQSRLSS